MYMPLSLNCNRKNDLNGNWIDYGTECIILTNTLYLKETFYNMTIFVTFNVTIDVMYNIEYSFIINNIYIRIVRVRIHVPYKSTKIHQPWLFSILDVWKQKLNILVQ